MKPCMASLSALDWIAANMTIDTYCIYVLCPRRDSDYVKQMLNAFLRKPVPASDEFEYPQFESPPRAIFHDPCEVISVVERETSQPYSLYWNEAGSGDSITDTAITQVMAFFTEDAQLIVGCAALTDHPGQVLEKACRILDAKYGFVTGDELPPSTAEEFKAVCKQAMSPRLLNGVLYR